MNTQSLNTEALAVIERVKKLLALAENNTNEHEAAVASAKAMEILAQHNLDMAVVGESRSTTKRADNKRKGGLYSWQRDLWKATCELNFCMYWSLKGLTAGSSYQHRVLGRHENVVMAETMADYLQGTVERLAQQWAKGQGLNVFAKPAIAYREGMSTRLVERLQDIRRQRLEADARKAREQAAASSHPGAAPGTGIVLASVIASELDLNNDYLQGWEPGTTARNRAESEARSAEWAAYLREKREQAEAARDAAELADPSLKVARLAKEAEQKRLDAIEDEKRQRKYARQNAAWQAKWDAGWRPKEPKERAPTARELRANTHEFHAGRAKGDEVGLDDQIEHHQGKAIG